MPDRVAVIACGALAAEIRPSAQGRGLAEVALAAAEIDGNPWLNGRNSSGVPPGPSGASRPLPIPTTCCTPRVITLADQDEEDR